MLSHRVLLSICTVALIALAGGSAAPAGANSRQMEGGTVAIPSGGPGSPYPSSLTFTGIPGIINSVGVRLELSHEYADDLDILLVSPSGTAVMLMSDACGASELYETVFWFNANDAHRLPDDPEYDDCADEEWFGTTPANFDPGSDPLPPPAPAGPYSTTSTLAAFNGENPNGTWKLFVYDDQDGAGGTLHGWSLSIGDKVLVPGTPGLAGPAAAYPFDAGVWTSSERSYVESVSVILDGESQHLDDLDVLLVGPGGHRIMLMSDALGNPGGLVWFQAQFTPEATTPMRDEFDGSWGTGDPVAPTDWEPGESLPPPAPPAPYGHDLSVFAGLPAGGPWKVYAADDTAGDDGAITAAYVNETTRPPRSLRLPWSASFPPVAEGSVATFTLHRDAPPPTGEGSVRVRAAGGNGAQPGRDFTPVDEVVTFGPGVADVTVPVSVLADNEPDFNEYVALELSDPAGDLRIEGPTRSASVLIAGPTQAPTRPSSPAPVPRRPTAAAVIVLPSTRRCLARNRLVVSFRNPRVGVRETTVDVNGKRMATQRWSRALRRAVIRRLPKPKAGRYTVRVRVRLTDGKVLTLQRRYRACT